jgi:hypothetical protein
MNLLFFCLTLMFSGTAVAHPCPEYLKEKPKALKALEFLKRWPGKFALGRCQIEVFTCSGWEKSTDSTPIAEILISDDQGREAYASLQYPEVESSFFKTKTLVQDKVLHFEKTDRFYEDEFGRTEVLRLELVTDWKDPQQLKHLELGIYSTHHQLDKADGNKSEWFVCSEEDPI